MARASRCQRECRGFESHHPLLLLPSVSGEVSSAVRVSSAVLIVGSCIGLQLTRPSVLRSPTAELMLWAGSACGSAQPVDRVIGLGPTCRILNADSRQVLVLVRCWRPPKVLAGVCSQRLVLSHPARTGRLESMVHLVSCVDGGLLSCTSEGDGSQLLDRVVRGLY